MFLKDFIKNIKARQIITSKGTFTVEVEFELEKFSIFSSFPLGQSKGSLEAKVIEDDKETNFNSNQIIKTVYSVVDSIERLSPTILNTELCSGELFDSFLISLDGTRYKTNLGSNFTLPISVSYWKLQAFLHNKNLWEYFLSDDKSHKVPLVHFNLLNGGLHSGNGLACQEIMLCFDRDSFKEQVNAAIYFYKALGERISSVYGNICLAVGDEGGYAPPLKNLEEALDLVKATANEIGITKYKIALDMAANSFYKEKKYHLSGCINDIDNTDNNKDHNKDHNKDKVMVDIKDNNKDIKDLPFLNKNILNGKELAIYYENLIEKYPIYSIEDPFAEDDYSSWEFFYSKVANKINIVADDLTVTNTEIIKRMGNRNMFNTVLIKPSQVGTVQEAKRAVDLCREKGLKVMFSHRSAETEDTFIVDFAVGMQAEYLKAGAPCRGERTSKYNQLIRIEEKIEKLKRNNE